MSDDEFDALLNELDSDDDDTATAPATSESNVANTSLNTSANEEKLRNELEEMKRKMAMMEAMLASQGTVSTTPKVTPQKHNKSAERIPKVTPQKPLKTPQKQQAPVAPKTQAPTLAGTFKNTIKSPDNTSVTPHPAPTAPTNKPKPSLSDTFSNALNLPTPPVQPKTTVATPQTRATAMSTAKAARSTAKTGTKSITVDMGDSKVDKCLHSGIRITDRKVSKGDFNCAIATRKFIKIAHLPVYFKDKQDVQGDWVTCGVIVRKVGPYKSSSGHDYSIWTLSDLVSLENTISLFLFKDNHIEHRKEQIGTVIGILNPSFMPPRDQEKNKKSDLAFSVDNPKKVLHMGMATDYGTCRNVTKSGQTCNNFINKALTQHCDFHMVKVHAQMRNKRMALSGSFTPSPNMSKMGKLRQECQAFTHKGSVYYPNIKPPTNKMTGAPVTSSDSLSTVALKKKGVMISTPLVNSEEFENRLKLQTVGAVQLKRSLEGIKTEKDEEGQPKRPKFGSPKAIFKKHVVPPKLGGGATDGFVNLNFGPKKLAKAKAVAVARQLGGFKPTVTNSKRHQLTPEQKEETKKRSLGLEVEKVVEPEILNGPSDMLFHAPIHRHKSSVNTNKENKSKQKSNQKNGGGIQPKKGILSAAFKPIDPDSAEGKKIMRAQSMNVGTLREAEIERTTDYFNALEKFEFNEEKLMNVKEIKITVYICDKCNTATQKQTQKCIDLNHLVRKGPAKKKFFKCRSCQNRTDVVGLPFPDHGCSKCGKVAWEKCSMYHEKKGPKLDVERLVVRGEDVELLERCK